MRCDTEKVFPGLRELVSNSRYERVNDAVQSFFTKSLHKMRDGFPFVITGDIPAMWLRDSTWQVKPLLRSKQADIVELLLNISKSQVKLFLKDPYANAFNSEPNGNCWHRDFVDQSPWVFERKFELDSWASVLFLARKVHEYFGRIDHLDDDFQEAVALMLRLAKIEQNHNRNAYVFKRENGIPHDSLSHEGKGAPIGYSGMVYSGFRPSDDACVYGYLIPSNLFLMSELKKLNIPKFRDASTELANEIQQGLTNFGLKDGFFAYEVDGLGNRLFIDDANVPSLLSLPYLEVLPVDDAIYQRTRAFVLSEKNPFYFAGTAARGLGSQHTPPNHVWPIAIAIQALTSNDINDQLDALEILEETDAGTGRMHESFHVDDPTKFTREWFSWSDMTYVDLVLTSVGYRYKL
jgi:meiotically up-regulated gene 157 (Mug157) protein